MKRVIFLIIPAAIFLTTLVAARYAKVLPAILAPLYRTPEKSASISALLKDVVQQALPQTDPEKLSAGINALRTQNQLGALNVTTPTCQVAESLPPDLQALSQQDIGKLCPQCATAAIATAAKYSSLEDNLHLLQSASASAAILDNKQFTHLCILDRDPVLLLFFAALQKPTPAPTKKPVSAAPAAGGAFSEDRLWQALVDYRHAHKKPDLIRDEKICTYARKRVDDQIQLMKSTPQDKYPVPDKYPLDGHSGFQKDAESGTSFTMAGKNQLAENLAYWPNAQYADQVIEWGWDASTEGHRETQLSTEYTHACLTGKDGFYVAIYGK